MEIRPYDPDDPDDVAALWTHKQAFERGLGAETGGEEKATAYEAKITDSYRAEWLEWVERCVAAEERCVTVADAGDGYEAENAGDESENGTIGDEGEGEDDGIVGYVFVLPETHRFIWDAAVLNEIFVAPAYRGEGVADDLMDAALALATDQDLPIDRLILDVDPDNERARRFYDRHGFEAWGELVARPL
ncbi:Ribosomal protein S18 acetylase RimI [Halopenitus malekzadehii]|uniref:Ribosomal protein S18 acetylase RimI n=1 Tax=Halopenitus malekzadehii TaxID=1267564 RepID=A0A1H6IK85_9EURY|nr:GNAT family N-acetyltransferase [Halopenitus malekzadehii]SEH49391.1 Ribosomal protein S18 acetylase RimI [Halopenitus malekzadehii]